MMEKKQTENRNIRTFTKVFLASLLIICFISILPFGSRNRQQVTDEVLNKLYRDLSNVDRKEQSLRIFAKYDKDGADYLLRAA
jgi:predicted nucleic-acid-binding protein